jgi:hypothetical protein
MSREVSLRRPPCDSSLHILPGHTRPSGSLLYDDTNIQSQEQFIVGRKVTVLNPNRRRVGSRRGQNDPVRDNNTPFHDPIEISLPSKQLAYSTTEQSRGLFYEIMTRLLYPLSWHGISGYHRPDRQFWWMDTEDHERHLPVDISYLKHTFQCLIGYCLYKSEPRNLQNRRIFRR